jgi:hypothetical protein
MILPFPSSNASPGVPSDLRLSSARSAPFWSSNTSAGSPLAATPSPTRARPVFASYSVRELSPFCSQPFLMFASATLGGFLSGHLWPSDFFSDGCRATFKDRHRRKVRHGRHRRQATRYDAGRGGRTIHALAQRWEHGSPLIGLRLSAKDRPESFLDRRTAAIWPQAIFPIMTHWNPDLI